MDKRRLIFDLDGTLIDFNSYYRSVKHLFDYSNILYTDEDIYSFIKYIALYEKKFPNFDKIAYYLFLKNKSHMDITLDGMNEFYSRIDLLIPYSKIDDDTLETLQYLNSKYDLVVLTNYFREVQLKRIEQMGFLNMFSQIYGGEEYMKPNPKSFLNALGPFDLDECIMIGDNMDIDIVGAKNVGLDAIKIDPDNRRESIKELKKKL